LFNCVQYLTKHKPSSVPNTYHLANAVVTSTTIDYYKLFRVRRSQGKMYTESKNCTTLFLQ